MNESSESHSWAYIQRRTWSEMILAPQCSLKHYLQQPRHGSNLNVNQQGDGEGRCNIYIQWNISQPFKRME